jgi:hypothetical protein
MEDWRSLSLAIDGDVYYSYWFVRTGDEFTIGAVGDLDGDGNFQQKLEHYDISGNALLPRSPTADSPNPEYLPEFDLRF